MPTLIYSARDPKGVLLRGHSEARTKEELARSLQAKGLTVVAIQEGKVAPAPSKKLKRFHKRARLTDLSVFAKQMAVLLESGVPILKTINVVAQQVDSQTLLSVCKSIEEDLKAGSSLRDAISRHPKVFSQMWIDLIETGEATGQLAFVLKKLAEYFDSVIALRKKVISALIYPVILIIVASAAIFIFMYRVVPIFASIYKTFGKLPALTQLVINFSNALAENIFKIIFVAAASAFILSKYVRTEKGRRQLDSFKLKIPVAGGLFLSIAIERFTTALAMMLKGGVSIVHSLEIAIKSTGNKIIEEALEKVKLSVVQGKTISGPIAETGIFPPLVTQMITVGEESGKLVQLLDEVSKFYIEDISEKVTRLMALFEPAIFVVMGVIIGTLVIAMYLPIFTLGQAAGG